MYGINICRPDSREENYQYVVQWNGTQGICHCIFVHTRNETQGAMLTCYLCRRGVEHSSLFICYATFADEVKLVQMGVDCSTIFICYAACVDDVKLVDHSVIFICYREVTVQYSLLQAAFLTSTAAP